MQESNSILTSSEILNSIDSLCHRHFQDPNLADQCYTYILEQLKKDDYKRLRAYQGESSIKTYVLALSNRLIIDFRRQKYGRRRIPKTISQIGLWAEKVYELVCWRYYSLREAFDLVTIQGLFRKSFKEFKDRIEPLYDLPCRENPEFISFDEDYLETPAHNPNSHRENPLELILRCLDEEKKQAAAGVIAELWTTLSNEEQLFVGLVFGKDVSAASAGRSLGWGPARSRKKKKQLLAWFREKLLEKGIGSA
ncbi:MAG TPA: hypothetical protein VKN82_08215 [Desulfohalobiaceae bacterium]|nr:hypothetical protein [Desulfohalobiaceae bacterium]